MGTARTPGAPGASGTQSEEHLRALHTAVADQQGELEGVSTVEVFGFVGWITSFVAYVLYLVWAYTPAAVLDGWGVHYHPSRYWAVALPAWACATVVAAYWLYESLCMASAPAPGDAAALRDWATRRKGEAGMPSYFSAPGDAGIPPLADIPAELATMVLHGGLEPREAERLYDRRQQQRQRVRIRL